MRTIHLALKTSKDKYISKVFRNFVKKQSVSRKLIKNIQVPYIDFKEFIELAKDVTDFPQGHLGNMRNIQIIVVRNCLYYAKNVRCLNGAKCLECAYNEYDNYFLAMYPEYADIDF